MTEFKALIPYAGKEPASPHKCANIEFRRRESVPRPMRVLGLFRSGMDTCDIAKQIVMTEAETLALLHQARIASRQTAELIQ